MINKKLFIIITVLLGLSVTGYASASGRPAAEKLSVSYTSVSAGILQDFKKKFGTYQPGKNYNIIIDGHGTGLTPPTDEQWEELRKDIKVTSLVTRLSADAEALPESYDCSQSSAFPPIGNQMKEGSCASWAIGYYFKTYQEAKEHGWDLSGAGTNGLYTGSFSDEYSGKIFCPDFLYHLINTGEDTGSYFWSPLRIINKFGMATFKTMQYLDYDHSTWPPLAAWREAPIYRTQNEYSVIDTKSGGSITDVKELLYSGNLGVIAVDAYQYGNLTLDDELWTIEGYTDPVAFNHANTVVGYDDNFGPYKEEGETRYGAFKVVNQWGTGYEGDNNNDGFFWISYAAFKEKTRWVWFAQDIEAYDPEMTAVYDITHDKRGECDIFLGIGDPQQPVIEKSISEYIFGGQEAFPDNKILVDVSEFKDYITQGSFYMRVFDRDITDSTGTITSLKIELYDTYDTQGNADTIYSCTGTPLNTVNGSSVTLTISLSTSSVQNPDTTAPQAPEFVSSDTSVFDRISVNWLKPTQDEDGAVLGTTEASLAGYKIYRSTIQSPGNWQDHFVTTIYDSDTTYYADTLVTDNFDYYYCIRAFNYSSVNETQFINISTYSQVYNVESAQKDLSLSDIVEPLGVNSGLKRSCVGWADYDNDGDLDLAVMGTGTGHYNELTHRLIIYKNQDGVFTNAFEPLGANEGIYDGTLSWADMNNDGYPDLIASGSDGTNYRLIVFWNDEGTFSQIYEPLGHNEGLYGGSVVPADYDNDGDFDLAVTGSDGDNYRLIVFYNDKGLLKSTTEPMGADEGIYLGSMISADYDSDGDADLVVTGFDGSNERFIIFTNEPDSQTFTAALQPFGASAGLYGGHIAAGDYDSDGDLDLAVTGDDGSDYRFIIIRNDGGGASGLIEPLGANLGSELGGLAWGDYDNDGDLDLTMMGIDTDINRLHFIVYQNKGNDTFSDTIYPVGSDYGGYLGYAKWGDYNNDGKLDLAAVGRIKHINGCMIFKNNTQTVNVKPSGPVSVSPDSVDFVQGSSVTFQWNAGTDYTTAAAALNYNIRIGTAAGVSNIKSADVNTLLGNIGHATQWTLNTDYLQPGTYYWNVQAIDTGFKTSSWSQEYTFTVSLSTGVDTTAPAAPSGISALALDQQGQVYLSWSKPTLDESGSALDTSTGALAGYNIYRAKTQDPAGWGSCLIASIRNADTTNYTDTVLEDKATYYYRLTSFDTHTRDSAEHQNESAYSSIYQVNIPQFEFFKLTEIDVFDEIDLTINSYAAAFGDYDNDGDVDFTISGIDADDKYQFIVYRNDDGYYAQASQPMGTNGGTEQGSLAWGDYDNDADLDIIISGYYSELALDLYNTDKDSFTYVSSPLGHYIGAYNSACEWGDYDNDGDLDLAVIGYASVNRFIIFENNNGTLEKKFDPLGLTWGLKNGSLAWGDYDNDGDLDIAVSGNDSYNKRLMIFKNDDSVFTSKIEPMGANQGLYYSSLAWGDYDGDGDLDLAASGSDGTDKRLIIFKNDGSDTFTQIEPMGQNLGVYRGSLAWCDFDNDGDLDLAVSGAETTHRRLIIFRNNNGTFVNNCEPFGENIGIRYSDMVWTDYDKDGDCDLVVHGEYSTASNVMAVLKNQSLIKNSKPGAPALSSPVGTAYAIGDKITFQWGESTDNETPSDAVTFNLRIGTSSAKGNAMGAFYSSSISSFAYCLSGNVGNANEWVLDTSRLAPQQYYWSVQAQDGGLHKSEWSQEQTFVLADSMKVAFSTTTNIVISNEITIDTPTASVTIKSSQTVDVSFSLADTSLSISAELSVQLTSDTTGTNLVIRKLDASEYNEGTDLITSYNSFPASVCELSLITTSGTVISDNASAFENNPVLSLTALRQDYPVAQLQQLQILTFDRTLSEWVSAGDTLITVTTSSVTASVELEHFSVFGMFFAPSLVFSQTADDIIVYPNPYVPNDTDVLNGTPTSGIFFDNVPEDSSIDIYTVSGSQVVTLNPDTSPYRWNVKNQRGESVVSGIYFYMLKSPTGKKTGKIGIIK